MCKVWKTYIHIIHGVNTGKIGNAHRLYTAKTESYPQGYPQIVDNVDYGYKISCGKRKNRTGICTCAADSVDKLWINRKSAHGRHGQRQTGKPRQSGIFPEKTAKIIDFRVDEMGVYEYN